MSIDFDFLLTMLEFVKLSAVVLSQRIGFGGCVCPSSCAVHCMTKAFYAFMNNAEIDASTADDTTGLIMLHSVYTAP